VKQRIQNVRYQIVLYEMAMPEKVKRGPASCGLLSKHLQSLAKSLRRLSERLSALKRLELR
jgi:hypothetical protein